MNKQRKALVGMKLAVENAREIAENVAKEFQSAYAADIAGDLFDISERIDRKIQDNVRREMLEREGREVEHIPSGTDRGQTSEGDSGVQIRRFVEKCGSLVELFRVLDDAVDNINFGIPSWCQRCEDITGHCRYVRGGCGTGCRPDTGRSGGDNKEDAGKG